MARYHHLTWVALLIAVSGFSQALAKDVKPEPKVIYGPDDRLDLYQITDPLQRRLAGASCGIVAASDLTAVGDSWNIRTSVYSYAGLPPCEGEPFAGQPMAPTCSAFWVGGDLIVTAGHCINASNLSARRFVFGFAMNSATEGVTTLPSSHVYRPVELVGWESAGTRDYAVVRVERVVAIPGVVPVDIRREGKAAVGTSVGVIGHPARLPQKIAFGGTTRVVANSHDHYLVANLDTYGGNSGSPVFNAITGAVEGILVRGEPDFVTTGGCFRSNVLSDDRTQAEEVTRTTLFSQLIPTLAGVRFVKAGISCTGTIVIEVRDTSGGEPGELTVYTSAGDLELVTPVAVPGREGYWQAELPVSADTPLVTGSGALDVRHGDSVFAAYPDGGSGGFLDAVPSTVDCVAPAIQKLDVSEVGADWVRMVYALSEPSRLEVEVLRDAGGAPPVRATVEDATSGTLLLSGLPSCTLFQFMGVATDASDNATTQTAGLPGTFFTTRRAAVREVQDFEAGLGEWTVTKTMPDSPGGLAENDLGTSGTMVFAASPGAGRVDDVTLESGDLFAVEFMRFDHTFSTEEGFDGAVIEVLQRGAWQDLETRIVEGTGYTGTISDSYGSPLSGRRAWTGRDRVGAMERVVVNLGGLESPLRVRFRWTSDESVSSNGWLIDTIVFSATTDCDKADRWEVVDVLLGVTPGSPFFDLNGDRMIDPADVLAP